MQTVTEKISSLNPRTGRIEREFPMATEQEVQDVVSRARQAFPKWSRLSFKERGAYIRRFRKTFLAHSRGLVAILSEEQGRPVAESYFSEVLPNVDLLQYWAQKAGDFLKREKVFLHPIQFPGKRGYIEFEPLGLVAIIAPWNYSISIPLRQIIPALMAGNVVILKPSEKVPRVSAELNRLFQESGLPEGVFQMVLGDGRVGSRLVQSGVQKVFFTGSVATGRRVLADAAERLTPVSLELGGKDPAIVFADADLERAANGILWGACVNAGQSCNAIERVYVERKVYEPLKSILVHKVLQLKWQGEEADVGPLIDGSQWKKVEGQLDDAIQKGGKILSNGRVPPNQEGFFFPPTLIDDVNLKSTVLSEETFGPLVPLVPFDTEEEAITKANDSRFGLAASVWTRDLERGERIAKRLEVGHVTINNATFTPALYQVPWGGVKESGFGMTNSRHALMEMVHPKFILVDRSRRKTEPWWYPYDESAKRLAEGLVRFLSPRGIGERLRGVVQALKAFPKRKGLQ